MPSISGSQTNMGVKIATTWGTPVACGTANRFAAEVTPNFNVNTLTARSIGSGAYLRSDFTRGNYIPTFSVTADLGYRNNCDVLIAQCMGTSAAPTEITASQSDFRHNIFFNTTLNGKYVTLAYETTNTTIHEAPTCAVRQFGIRTTSVPGYLEFTAELLAGIVNLSSATNTNATLAATTFTEGTPELVACDFADAFRTNAQSGGSIVSGNLYSITSFDFSFTRPQDIIPEIKGSAGNSAPVGSGVAEGTFNITVKELADHAYYTIWSAETAQKASVDIQGTQLGTGTNKAVKLYLPRLLLVTEPQYSITSEGTNTLSLNFNVAKAAAVPTGMAAGSNGYPYFEITNTLATSLLA